MHVIIVGAGLAGTATAWYLRQGGATVTVIERGDAAAMETSFANAGMLTPSMADPWNAPGTWRKLLRWIGREDAPMLLRPHALPSLIGWGLQFLWHSRTGSFHRNTVKNVRLALYSLAQLQQLREQTGIEYDAASTGTLRACRDQASLDRAAALAAFLAEHGVAHRVLDRAGLVGVEPALAPIAGDLVGGIHYSRDESGDAHMFTRNLAQRAAEAGVRFVYRSEFTGVRMRGGQLSGVEYRCAERRLDGDTDPVLRANSGVEPEHGETILDGDAVVLAAGSFTPVLARRLGLSVPVRPVKGYSITAPVGDWASPPRIPVSDDHLHAAVTPLGDRIRVAGTAEFTGYDDTLSPSRVANLNHLLHALYPDYATRLQPSSVTPWCGFRPVSADGVPILGSTPLQGLYMNTGQGPLGWTMAAGCGRLLADVVLGQKPALDMNDYALARF
ncbi:MAG: FAD-dependent oxidoreductase [Gammaproteobacteria bacterium]